MLLLISNTLLAFYPQEDENPTASNIHNAVCVIVDLVKSSMGAVFLVLIVLAAIVYAAGQVMGAETRARANVWATSMFVGAIIGGLIFLIVPLFLSQLLGQDIADSCPSLN